MLAIILMLSTLLLGILIIQSDHSFKLLALFSLPGVVGKIGSMCKPVLTELADAFSGNLQADIAPSGQIPRSTMGRCDRLVYSVPYLGWRQTPKSIQPTSTIRQANNEDDSSWTAD